MKSSRRKSNLHRHHPEPEYGDWRVSLARPEDAEHYHNPPVSVWKRTCVRVEELQAAPLGPLMQHSMREWNEAGASVEEASGIVPINGWPRFLRLFLAMFLLLPVCVVMVFALMMQLYHAAPVVGEIGFWVSEPVWFSLMGAAVFITLMVGGLAEDLLVYVYVLGHELTHALAAKLCFGKVRSISIRLDGGYVETDADNVFIALAPYFVPLWMLCWMLVFWVAGLICPFDACLPWMCAGGGFWWLFHLYWTVWVIPREQPDMLENGILFSLLVVILMNILLLLGILCLFDVVSPAGYMDDFVRCATRIYTTWKEFFLLLFPA